MSKKEASDVVRLAMPAAEWERMSEEALTWLVERGRERLVRWLTGQQAPEEVMAVLEAALFAAEMKGKRAAGERLSSGEWSLLGEDLLVLMING